MSELLPCPFCGGEAELVEGDYGMFMTGYAIYCKYCCTKVGVTGRLGEAYEWTPIYDTKSEAIAAWNARAERTCKCVAEYAKSPIDGKTIVLHRCSACHELMRPHMNYCPNCGAKLVEE